MDRIISLLIGYLFGCILPADIVSRCFTGKPIREVGSGNPGMTNVLTNIGTLPGLLTLGGDILKTALAMGLSFLLFGNAAGRICIHYAGFGAVLGHDFPFWRGWSGGKGVTVTCTWMILGFGLWGIFCELFGAITVFSTGWLPVAAVVIGAAPVPMVFRLSGMEAGLLAMISFILMLLKHIPGLGRIHRGEEPRRFQLWKRSEEPGGKS